MSAPPTKDWRWPESVGYPETLGLTAERFVALEIGLTLHIDELERHFQEGDDLDWRECGAIAENLRALLARVRGK